MKNKAELFTVIGLCHCGCDDSFIEFVSAKTPEGAGWKALRERGRPGTVAAVINGAHQNELVMPLVK